MTSTSAGVASTSSPGATVTDVLRASAGAPAGIASFSALSSTLSASFSRRSARYAASPFFSAGARFDRPISWLIDFMALGIRAAGDTPQGGGFQL